MDIANPIYDVVFKYLMEDNKVAKKLISAIIGEEIIELDFASTERIDTNVEVEKKTETTTTTQTLTVCHFDFRAKIRVPDGYKTVLIELQKAKLYTDIMRFRRYLGDNYKNSDNNYYVDNKLKSRQIYCIFILNYNAGSIDAPVVNIDQRVTDNADGKEYTERNEFIESLHHRSWIVQIKSLPSRRRNELEKLLSIFDQDNRLSDEHILNIKEADFPKKYSEVIRRLQKARETPKILEQMTIEDEIIEEFQIRERIDAEKDKVIVEKDKAIVEKDKVIVETKEALVKTKEALAETKEALAETKEALAEKDKALIEKNNAILEILAEHAKEIAELKRLSLKKE
ncbi:MAG: hypothetical protein LBT50_09710 [Prevotellaceae bacterium]|jgi:hypothetical protein|nr:hypothetical protein [Prevotellaceae bacterium]